MLCGPEGLYPVCYVRCNSDCGDVKPAQGRGRCQSKNACEEHRQNATGNGIVGRTFPPEVTITPEVHRITKDNSTQKPNVDNNSKDVANTSNGNTDVVFELPIYDATEGMNNKSHFIYLLYILIRYLIFQNK